MIKSYRPTNLEEDLQLIQIYMNTSRMKSTTDKIHNRVSLRDRIC